MNLVGKDITRGLRQLEKAIGGAVFTWDGNDYPCVPGRSDALKLFGAGGFAPADTLVLNVRRCVLPAAGPQPRDPVVFQEYEYQIDTVSSSPDGSWVKLSCLDPNRDA